MTQRDPPENVSGDISRDTSFIQLRLLETTDVHANLLPFDYYAGTGEAPFGLARAATLIRAARAETPNCLLFDNGDFVQGTPIGDMIAQPGSGWDGPHPSISAMNLLGYDAATLGNHEFNFGLEWLRQTLSAAEFPVVCANAFEPGNTAGNTLCRPYQILHRALTDSDGTKHDMRIGVLGLVPPQITTWDHFHLDGRLTTRDVVETARALVPQMQADGADVIVVLAHSGIDDDAYYPLKENAAVDLGAIPGVDAILAGHTHEVFPGTGHANIQGVDTAAGTLNGTPAVMAGFRASHLGVLDLFLQRSPAGWSVAAHRSQVRPVGAAQPGTQPVRPDAELCDLLQPAHAHTLALIDRPIRRSSVPLHSYLALVRNDPATQLVTRAQHAALSERLRGTSYANLPILSVSAPFKTGGRGGPDYYTDVPPGDLLLRNAADLYTFPNTLCGLLLTGAELRDWLERGAACFNQITPGKPDQTLCNPQVPGHNFDVIQGLTYQIDLSQPNRYDRSGRLTQPDAHRILHLCRHGIPVADDSYFIMATNSYRAHGGGPYPILSEDRFIAAIRHPIRDLLAQHMGAPDGLDQPVDQVWRFAPMPGTRVIYDTGPGIRRYPDQIKALGATDLGTTDLGFARLCLPL